MHGDCILRSDGARLQAFDQLLLLKRGGQTIYCGPLGLHSSTLITYFQVRPRPCNLAHTSVWISCTSAPVYKPLMERR